MGAKAKRAAKERGQKQATAERREKEKDTKNNQVEKNSDLSTVTATGPRSHIAQAPSILCEGWRRQGYCNQSFVKTHCATVCNSNTTTNTTNETNKEMGEEQRPETPSKDTTAPDLITELGEGKAKRRKGKQGKEDKEKQEKEDKEKQEKAEHYLRYLTAAPTTLESDWNRTVSSSTHEN